MGRGTRPDGATRFPFRSAEHHRVRRARRLSDLTLECGRYYFERGAIAGRLNLHVKGRTAIFVGGDFDVDGGLAFDLAPDADVDLFVAGNFSANRSGDLSSITTGTPPPIFGYPDAPARLRLYIGGTQVVIGNLGTVGANIDARRAVVQTGTPTNVYGSLYVKELKAIGWATFKYDSVIIDVPGCTPPDRQCNDCHDCTGAPAYLGGKCGPCQTGTDCCAPLRCRAGACVPPGEIL